MIAIIRPPLWRPYFFLAQAALDQMPSTSAASRRPGLSRNWRTAPTAQSMKERGRRFAA